MVAVARYALPLEGYDDTGVWGFDELAGTYFAQIWRNSSDSRNDPDIWLAGLEPIRTPLGLAELIAARTGVSTGKVVRALAAATTAPDHYTLVNLAETLPVATSPTSTA